MLVKLTKITTTDGRAIRSLTIGQTYKVLGLESDFYRLLNDTNQPYLYDPGCFEVVDAVEPSFWVCKLGAEGERYCYPSEWSELGFFEDFFDEKKEVVDVFWRIYRKLY